MPEQAENPSLMNCLKTLSPVRKGASGLAIKSKLPPGFKPSTPEQTAILDAEQRRYEDKLAKVPRDADLAKFREVMGYGVRGMDAMVRDIYESWRRSIGKWFGPMNRIKHWLVKKQEGTCGVGERSDLTGCTPEGGGGGKKPGKNKPEKKPRVQLPLPSKATVKREGFHQIERQADGSYTGAPKEVLERAKAIKLTPAWRAVQISEDAEADLQAVGYDDKGREQRAYSAAHWDKAEVEKFGRVRECVKELPSIESKASKDAATIDEAAVIMLIRKTGFRVGGEGGHKLTAHKALGASTLSDKNVKIDGDKVRFAFTGKKGVRINQTITDSELAAMLGPRVAKGGRLFDTDDGKVREYLHSIDGPFHPKDLRTVVAGETAHGAMEKLKKPKDVAQFAKMVKEVATKVAAKLGNTPAVCLSAYIDPLIWKTQWGFSLEDILKKVKKPKKVSA